MSLPTAVRILDVDSPATLVVALEDPANGLTVLGPMEVPEDGQRQGRRKSSRVRGSYAVGGPAIDDDGELGFTLKVQRETWPLTCQKWIDTRAALRSRSRYLVEVELSGVRTRWLCDAPARFPELPITNSSRVLNRRVFDMRFLVQPNPSVTIL